MSPRAEAGTGHWAEAGRRAQGGGRALAGHLAQALGAGHRQSTRRGALAAGHMWRRQVGRADGYFVYKRIVKSEADAH